VVTRAPRWQLRETAPAGHRHGSTQINSPNDPVITGGPAQHLRRARIDFLQQRQVGFEFAQQRPLALSDRWAPERHVP
jgi:hypothetical protein